VNAIGKARPFIGYGLKIRFRGSFNEAKQCFRCSRRAAARLFVEAGQRVERDCYAAVFYFGSEAPFERCNGHVETFRKGRGRKTARDSEFYAATLGSRW
jgi:hypothetical protein